MRLISVQPPVRLRACALAGSRISCHGLFPAHFHCLTASVQIGRYCWASRRTLEPDTCASRASRQRARSSPVISCKTLLARSGKSRSQALKRRLSARAVLADFLSVTSRWYRSTASARVRRGYSPLAPARMAASSATAHACASAFVGRVAVRRIPARSTSARQPFFTFLKYAIVLHSRSQSRAGLNAGFARDTYDVLYSIKREYEGLNGVLKARKKPVVLTTYGILGGSPGFSGFC